MAKRVEVENFITKVSAGGRESGVGTTKRGTLTFIEPWDCGFYTFQTSRKFAFVPDEDFQNLSTNVVSGVRIVARRECGGGVIIGCDRNPG